MKRAVILLLVFVFVTLLISSCVAGLRRNNNYLGYNDNYRGYNDNYRGYNDNYRGYNYNYDGYNGNYLNNYNYQYSDNQGNYYRRGKLFRNRYERNNHYYRRSREGQNTLIIH